MRKGLLIAVVAIGSAITGSAQTSQSGILKVSAAQVRRSNDQTFFSAGVEIVIPGARLRADNATIHADNKTIDLSGHVQVTLDTK